MAYKKKPEKQFIFNFVAPDGTPLTDDEARRVLMANIINYNIKRVKSGELDFGDYDVEFDMSCIISDELLEKMTRKKAPEGEETPNGRNKK